MDNQHTTAKEEINWKTLPTKWVDIDTGEEITEVIAKKSYVIIKTDKYVKIIKSTGTIAHTKQCRTSRQLKLW